MHHEGGASTSSDWIGLLAGSDQEQAASAVESIARDLMAFVEREDALDEEAASLAHGAAGVALFFHYASLANIVTDADQYAVRCLQRAANALAMSPMSPWLFRGFTGVAWAVQHIAPRDGDDDLCTEIDVALERLLRELNGAGVYDLISGLVGCGVYAMSRPASQVATRCAEATVALLASRAEQAADGTTWHTEPQFLPSHQRSLYPNGYYNLGVAHGVPGVIALLAQYCNGRKERSDIRLLTEGAIQWLLGQPSRIDSASRFGYFAGRGIAHQSTQPGWCYGDLGIAATLHVASEMLGDASYKAESIAIGCEVASRSGPPGDGYEPGLCHGAAGVAHLYHRLANASKNSQLATAALHWYRRTLALREPGRGVGGFSRYDRSSATWDHSPGFLDGAAGIGLALIAAMTSVPPEWDAALLLSPCCPIQRLEVQM